MKFYATRNDKGEQRGLLHDLKKHVDGLSCPMINNAFTLLLFLAGLLLNKTPTQSAPSAYREGNGHTVHSVLFMYYSRDIKRRLLAPKGRAMQLNSAKIVSLNYKLNMQVYVAPMLNKIT